MVLVNSGELITGVKGAALTKSAFSDILVVSPLVVTTGLLTFVFSTILGWSYYGKGQPDICWEPLRLLAAGGCGWRL